MQDDCLRPDKVLVIPGDRLPQAAQPHTRSIRRSVLHRWLVALAGVLLVSTHAGGQTPSAAPSPRFATVLAASQHVNAAADAAKHSTTWVQRACHDGSLTKLSRVAIWKQPEFDAAGVPIAGEWGERFQATGCGMMRLLNVVTSVRSPGVLVSGPWAPGDTTADPTLQRDASRYAFAAAMPHVPGCQQAFLDDTHVVRRETVDDARLTGPIRVEDWAIVACGKSLVAEMRFLPVASGTDIVAHVQ